MKPAFAAYALLVVSALPAVGQGDKAVVVGTVSDTSGAIVVNAQVELKRVSTNDQLSTQTTDTGDYAFRGLIPDFYELRVSASGFKTEVRSGLKFDVGGTYRIDIPLAVGQVSDVVEVNAVAPILKTESPELGQVLDNAKIMNLPLNNRDVFGGLAALTPGVMSTSTGGGLGSSLTFTVKGLRNSDNVGMIDGTLVSETNAAVEWNINPDAVQEFELKTGLYGAEYGTKPGGQFSVVTKSGTNELHGTVFDFLRNNHLDARNFFDPGPRPQFKRNQFGVNAGGPVYIPKLFNGKDKVFWFFAYDGQRVRRFQSLTGSVPTQDQKNGIFTQAIIDPLTGQPFPGNQIPQSRLSPQAQKFLQFWPAPNTAGRGFNYTSSSPSPSDNDEIIARIDFKTSANSRWSGRFIYNNQPLLFANPLVVFTRTDNLSNWSQNITNTRTIKNNYVNEFGIHFYRRPYFPGSGRSQSPADFGKTLGIPNWPFNQVDSIGVPVVSITGFLTVGDGGSFGPVPEGNWQIKDNFTFTKGAHLIKAGYEYRRQYLIFGFLNRSSFGFSNDRYTNNSFANFLLGYLTSATAAGEDRLNFHINNHSWYFNDSWRVAPKFTVNIGLRYELRSGFIDKRGFLTNARIGCVLANPTNPVPQCYDPKPTILNPPFPLTGRYEAGKPLYTPTKTGFQPRVGLAYRMTPNTVIRTGFGLYGNEPAGGMIYSALGCGRNPRANAGGQSFTSSPSSPNLVFSDPFNTSALVPGAALPLLGGFEDPAPQWYVENWGFSIERSLTPDTMIEVGYQGSHSVHEVLITEINDATPGPGNRQSRRPVPAAQSIQSLAGNGSSHYNALEVKFEKRAGRSGLSALSAFTWSKSIDYMGGRFRGFGGDPSASRFVTRNLPLSLNRGPGESNIPGLLTIMVGYELPFGRGKPYQTDTVVGKILGGWSINQLTTLRKGLWFTAGDIDRLDVGSAAGQRPQLVGQPNLPAGQRTPARWFDTAAFAVPPPFTYGNAGRGILEGPSLVNTDFSLLRSFRLAEQRRIEFRFEAFNIFNHPNFVLPDNNFASPTFGVIGSALESRDLQFGLKIYF